jgi:hypothetical protein
MLSRLVRVAESAVAISKILVNGCLESFISGKRSIQVNMSQEIISFQTILKSNDGRIVAVKEPTTTVLQSFSGHGLNASATACVLFSIRGRL